MRGSWKLSLASICAVGALAGLASAQETLTTVCLPFNGSSDVTGAEIYEVDCFQTPNQNMTWRATQLTTDCPLRQVSATGNIVWTAMTCDPDANASNGRTGGDPPINATNGLCPISVANCQAALTPPIGTANIPLTGGTRYYVATITYTVDPCVSGMDASDDDGDFLGYVRPGTYSTPPLAGDLTRSRNGANALVQLLVSDTPARVPTGTCCDGVTCEAEDLNETCCGTMFPGNLWTEGKHCADPNPCACTQDSDCDNGQFCDGAEICDEDGSIGGTAGACLDQADPVCPPGPDAQCTNGVCDPMAAAGAGACVVVNKADGLACTIGGEGHPDCDNPDTCLGGTCRENLEIAGTLCSTGGEGDADCDNQDTCNASGACQENAEANGFPCTPDALPCTGDACQGGTCEHPPLANGSDCDDGDPCTDNDDCQGGICAGDDAAATGGRCDDGIGCTLDSCSDDGTPDGLCVNTDINSIPCPGGDTDCPPGTTCGDDGTCDCSEFPDLTIDIRGNPLDSCFDEGATIVADVLFGGTAPSVCIAGGSYRILYDPSCLEFVSLSGGNPWSVVIFSQVSPGVIFLATGTPIGGPVKCTNVPGTMASVTFTKIGVCNDCRLCFDDQNPQHTYLTTDKGVRVDAAELGCSKFVHDRGVLSMTCPGDQEVNADCDAATASVSWPAVSASDTCDGTLDVACTCVHEPPKVCTLTGERCTDLEALTNSCGPGGAGNCVNKFPPINCNGLASSGGTFPQGRYTFDCAVDDEDQTCDGGSECTWTVKVSDETTLDVEIQLSPIVDNATPDPVTRCICFEVYASCFPEVVEEVCHTLHFGPPFDLPGHNNGDVKIPKGQWVCITARDRQHSLRATHFPLVCDGVSYHASFKGDPFFGGNWLTQGNLNRDPLIDILDFGTFLGQLNQNPTPDPKTCEDNFGDGFTHADMNGDGVVDVADYSFIQINFLENDKNSCCPDEAGSTGPAGRTEVSVKELREMGMGDLVIADLNNDGVLNTDDMVAYLQGARPKDGGKIDRGNGRPARLQK